MFCRINKMANFAWSSFFKLENQFNQTGLQEWNRSHQLADLTSLQSSLFEQNVEKLYSMYKRSPYFLLWLTCAVKIRYKVSPSSVAECRGLGEPSRSVASVRAGGGLLTRTLPCARRGERCVAIGSSLSAVLTDRPCVMKVVFCQSSSCVLPSAMGCSLCMLLTLLYAVSVC